MTVQSDSAERGQKEINKDWPNVEGDTLGTTKIDGREIDLVPEEGSHIRQEFKKGL